jgi:hypothetical protein
MSPLPGLPYPFSITTRGSRPWLHDAARPGLHANAKPLTCWAIFNCFVRDLVVCAYDRFLHGATILRVMVIGWVGAWGVLKYLGAEPG